MPKLKEVVYEVGGLVALDNYENFRVYYGERLILKDGEDAKEVKANLIARVEKVVESKIAEVKEEAARASRSKSRKK